MEKASKKLLVLCLSVFMMLGFALPASANVIISSTMLQAESASLTGGAFTATDHTGYLGTGFVAGYQYVGATTTFSYSPAYELDYTVTLFYSNGTGSAKTIDLYVDGVLKSIRNLDTTTNWNTWSYDSLNIHLTPGSHTIAYKYDASNTGNVNLDYIQIDPTQTHYVEAETGTFNANAAVHNDHSGYTGTGYAAFNAVGGSVTLDKVYSVSTAPYDTTVIRYANGNSTASTLSIYVNGTLQVSHVSFPVTADWNTWSTVTLPLDLAKGFNSVAFVWTSTDNADLNIDQVYFN
jgi:hypothetical protein